MLSHTHRAFFISSSGRLKNANQGCLQPSNCEFDFWKVVSNPRSAAAPARKLSAQRVAKCYNRVAPSEEGWRDVREAFSYALISACFLRSLSSLHLPPSAFSACRFFPVVFFVSRRLMIPSATLTPITPPPSLTVLVFSPLLSNLPGIFSNIPPRRLIPYSLSSPPSRFHSQQSPFLQSN